MRVLPGDILTARERVLATFSGRPTDRVPIFDMIQHKELIERVTGKELRPRNGLDLLCEMLSKSVDMTRSVYAPGGDTTWQDDEGFVYRGEWWTIWLVGRPFCDVSGACEYIRRCIERLHEMPKDSLYTCYGQGDIVAPDAADPNEGYRRLQAKLENVLLLPPESPVGLDSAYIRLGLELFIYAYAEDPELVSKWLEALVCHEIERVHRCADAELAPVAFVYCDLANKNGPMFSPAFLRHEFFPRLKRLVEAWHAHGVAVIYHSDGDYLMLLEDFAAAGVDGINPLETLERKDNLAESRKALPTLTLVGGIDSSNLLPYGTEREVEAAVKRVLDLNRVTGRYILGSTTEIHPGCDTGNILAMWQAALRFGRD